jgi:DNA repair protein RecO
MASKTKTSCYLLKKQPYSETSVLMQVFSDTYGQISILAKGLRKGKERRDYLLNVLNEYEFVVTSPSPSGIHILSEMTLIDEYPTDLPLENWFAAQAGAEILTKLILPDDEVPLFYIALKRYLDYQKSVTDNPLAIFWRYLLHLNKLLGIPVDLENCSCCHSKMESPAGYTADCGQLVCHKCLAEMPVANFLETEASNVIKLLPVIGNYLNDLVITPQTAKQVNSFFLHYLSLQFHRSVTLNSLQFFEPK